MNGVDRTLPSEADVVVWPLRLASAGEPLRFDALLSDDERARRDRYASERDRRAFVATRGVLRLLLAGYLDLSPASVAIAYGPNGKPRLAVRSEIRFNVSHSRDVALFAFATGCEIGVDVERVRVPPDFEAIARRFFSAEEVRDLAAVAEAERARAFLSCWTRKEAYLKAAGTGLATALDTFTVTLRSGESPRVAAIGGDADRAREWQLHDVPLGREYAGALAYEAARRSMRLQPEIVPERLLAYRTGESW